MEEQHKRDDSKGNSQGTPKGSPDKKSMPQGGNLVWYVLGLMTVLMLLATAWSGSQREEISWSDLERLVIASNPATSTEGAEDAVDYITLEETDGKERFSVRLSHPTKIIIGPNDVTGYVQYREAPLGQIVEADSGESQEIVADLNYGDPIERSFRTARDSEETRLAELLSANNIEGWAYAMPPSPLLNALPMLLMLGMLLMLMIVMMRRMGGAGSPMAFGRSKAKLHAQEDLEETFDSVAGVDEAVEELREVVDFLKNPDRYQRLGGRIPKGVLLIGPPGTGENVAGQSSRRRSRGAFFQPEWFRLCGDVCRRGCRACAGYVPTSGAVCAMYHLH